MREKSERKSGLTRRVKKRRRSPQDDVDINIPLGVKPEDQDKERWLVSPFSQFHAYI